jgi:hypothetical protein
MLVLSGARSAFTAAARGHKEQTDGRADKQKSQSIEDGRMTMAESLLKKEREHKAGKEADIPRGINPAGRGIELAATQAHGITP